jgi:hypothetical protein
VITLLAQARLQGLAKAAGVREIRAGPKGVALTLQSASVKRAAKRLRRLDHLSIDEDRILIASPTQNEDEQFGVVERLLLTLTPQ